VLQELGCLDHHAALAETAKRDLLLPGTSSIFSCLLHIQQLYFKLPDKAVILSEALRRSIAKQRLYGAESKDPGDACWQMLLGAFRPQTTGEEEKSQTPTVANPDFLPHRTRNIHDCAFP
jgi:hypothetical protein